MIFEGKFRSVDASVDPKGQLYKVLIMTNISKDGYYPYKYESPSQAQRPIKIPIESTKITLADSPFTVEYESGDDIYKPYKCSTATVRILLDKIQLEFMCTNKNDILVYLLRWNNNVVQESPNNMKNVVTGDKLYKKRLIGTETFFYDYIPEEYDKFCYTIDWVGYVTPNTYSQDYNKSEEPFELECQDVASTLKYYDYHVDEKTNRTFNDIIAKCAENVDSVYKHVYVTASVKLPEKISQPGSILDKISVMDDNWFDEDGKPLDCLSIIEQLMQYLSCTLIPYKDSIFIVNYDSLGSGFHSYHNYERAQQQTLLIPRNNTVAWVYKGNLSAGSNVDIDGTKLAASNTQVSTSTTYKKVELDTDEYYREHLIIDIEDDEQLKHISDFDAMAYIQTVSKVNDQCKPNVKYEYDDTKIVYTGQLFKTNDDKIPGKCIMYNYGLDRYVPPEGSLGFARIDIDHIERQYPNSWNQLTSLCGCSLVEFGSNTISDKTILSDLHRNYNGKRMFLFNAHAVFVPKHNAPALWDEFSFHNNIAPGKKQVMLHVETDNIFLRKDQYFQIQGNWSFYNTKFYPMPSGWTTGNNKGLAASLDHMFCWAKIFVTNKDGRIKYLSDDGSIFADGVNYSYKWIDQETWCKLYYGGQGFDDYSLVKAGSWFWGKDEYKMAGCDAFENEFSFVKNNRYVDGTIIQIPDFDGNDFMGKLTVEFNRPAGCGMDPGAHSLGSDFDQGYYMPQTSTLTDFDIKVIDKSNLTFHGTGEDNNHFEVKMNSYATDDYPAISSMLSSNYEKTTNLAGTCIKQGMVYNKMSHIANNGIGEVALPEKLVVDSIARTYKNSNIVLDVVIHNKFAENDFLDSFTWSTQFGDKVFIPTSMSVDFENDMVTLSLFERKPNIITDRTTLNNTTRNYRRNGDNLVSELTNPDKKFLNTAFQPFNIDATFMKGAKGDLVVDGVNPGLIEYANIEPDFETGEVILATPNNVNITMKNSGGNLIIEYKENNIDIQ